MGGEVREGGQDTFKQASRSTAAQTVMSHEPARSFFSYPAVLQYRWCCFGISYLAWIDTLGCFVKTGLQRCLECMTYSKLAFHLDYLLFCKELVVTLRHDIGTCLLHTAYHGSTAVERSLGEGDFSLNFILP